MSNQLVWVLIGETGNAQHHFQWIAGAALNEDDGRHLQGRARAKAKNDGEGSIFSLIKVPINVLSIFDGDERANPMYSAVREAMNHPADWRSPIMRVQE